MFVAVLIYFSGIIDVYRQKSLSFIIAEITVNYKATKAGVCSFDSFLVFNGGIRKCLKKGLKEVTVL